MTERPPQRSTPLMHQAWPYAALLLLNLIFFWDSVFGGKVLCMRDSFCDLFPFRQFAANAFQAGAIPLWNSVSGFGKPFLADPIAGALYPPHLLFVVLPATWAFKLSYILHFFIAGAGMFALMRHWKFSTGAALLAAVVFTFNTWLMAWVEFFCSFNVIIWWPFTMLVAQQILDRELNDDAPRSWFARVRRNFGKTVLFAVLIACQYLAGSPELVLYSLLAIGAFVALRCMCARNFRALMGCGIAFSIAGMLVLCLVLPQFLLTMEFIGYSERSGEVNPRLEIASFSPANLLTLVFPFIYGRPGYPQEFWAQSIYEFCMGTCYLGIVPVMFGLFSFYLWRKRSPETNPHRFVAIFFAGLAVLGLLMAAGMYTPLYKLVYSCVPLFRHFRWPTKFLVWVAMGGSVLAGVGLEAFFKTSQAQKARVRWTSCVLIGWGVPWLVLLILFNLSGNPTSLFKWLTRGTYVETNEHLRAVSNDMTIGLLFVGISLLVLAIVRFTKIKRSWSEALLITVTFANLFVVSRQVQFIAPDDIYEYQPQTLAAARQQSGAIHSSYTGAQQYLYGSTNLQVWHWAKEVALGATWLPYGVPHNWQGGLKLERHLTLYSTLNRLPPDKAGRLADIMGIGLVMTGPPFENIVSGQSEPTITLNARTSALPRAYVVRTWAQTANVADGLGDMTDPAFNPTESALIENGPAAPAQIPDPSAERKILSLTDGWNRVTLEAEAASGGLLVLKDAWYPGWKAKVDGREQPILRANLLFRGVVLPAGKHKVEFTYEPWQFRVGLLVSLAALLGIVLPTFALTALRRRRPITPQTQRH